MASTQARIAQYHYRVDRTVSTKQQHHHRPVKPTDSFVFDAVGLLRIRPTDPNSSQCVYNLPPLFQTSISITCERFFLDKQDFLLKHITNQPYFPSHCLDILTDKIIPQVQQLFAFDTSGFSKPSDNSGPQEFPLSLRIVVDEMNDDLFQRAVMEESMQQNVRMIPASNEAIQSLKTYKLPDQCQICKQKFHGEGDDNDDDDDVEFTPLPCGHGFHHQCILQWLQTSHMCPMCRYPLPTANN